MPDVTELRVVGDDTIELDGISIARLLPNLSLSIRDRLTEIFDAIDADADYIAELKDRVAQLESGLATPASGGGRERRRQHVP